MIAFRNLKRNKGYYFINIFGLAVGMACCIVIMLFVKDELSYDRFHENAGRIYRLTVKRKIPTGEQRDTLTPSNAGPNMVSDFPEVVDAVRLDQPRVYIVEHGDKRFTTDPVGADPSILDVFTFPLVMGDKRTALKDPDNVVISEGLAEKMFGDENPMGKVITLYGVDPDERHDYTVTGIMKDIPHNSHLRFEFLVPREEDTSESARSRPGPCVTYLLLDKNADPKELEKKLPEFTLKYYGERYAQRAIFRLQPLTSIHLRSDLDYDEIVEKKGEYFHFLFPFSGGSDHTAYRHHQFHEPFHGASHPAIQRGWDKKGRGCFQIQAHQAIPQRVHPVFPGGSFVGDGLSLIGFTLFQFSDGKTPDLESQKQSAPLCGILFSIPVGRTPFWQLSGTFFIFIQAGRGAERRD